MKPILAARKVGDHCSTARAELPRSENYFHSPQWISWVPKTVPELTSSSYLNLSHRKAIAMQQGFLTSLTCCCPWTRILSPSQRWEEVQFLPLGETQPPRSSSCKPLFPSQPPSLHLPTPATTTFLLVFLCVCFIQFLCVSVAAYKYSEVSSPPHPRDETVGLPPLTTKMKGIRSAHSTISTLPMQPVSTPQYHPSPGLCPSHSALKIRHPFVLMTESFPVLISFLNAQVFLHL